MIRAAIIDDHPLARLGITQILTDSGRVQVSAAVGSASELAAVVDEAAPDVVVCDLYHNGDQACLEAVATLATTQRTLVISASGRPADVIGAIRAGAGGYITKHADPALLIGAVETVAAGGFALSPQLADILHADLGRDAGRPPGAAAAPALSPREEQALSLIADGLTHAQVATRMGVTRKTVETYVERIRVKLQVGNKAELTRAALERLGTSRSS
ncbi:LuxR C-terminal-related transcriptional regulator [Streptacidiphilus sp. MAP12-20]|uniref:LuxR C-terminal-related transcriptional regulator n=1 Tax=Streptacidiphilus sp. MAP12-20 TaxID=3156299 RepID=UPI00351582F1